MTPTSRARKAAEAAEAAAAEENKDGRKQPERKARKAAAGDNSQPALRNWEKARARGKRQEAEPSTKHQVMGQVVGGIRQRGRTVEHTSKMHTALRGKRAPSNQKF